MKVGIALGGGGAKGLAHIPMLEVIDEFGLEVHQICGTSIGAVIGVLYASGYTALEIREIVNHMSFLEGESLLYAIKQKQVLRWFEYINVDWSGKALLKADAFLSDLMIDVKGKRFEELKIPLKVVAADFWKRSQVVLDSGEIKKAIHASMALPGIFVPPVINGQVLIDGGTVNPVPFDLLDDCDVKIAINVMGNRTESAQLIPSFGEAVFNSLQILQATILKQKLKDSPPDILVAPNIVDIQMLEFYKAEEIFNQSERAKEELRWQLDRILNSSDISKHSKQGGE